MLRRSGSTKASRQAPLLSMLIAMSAAAGAPVKAVPANCEP
jgi:hypothetical protein